MTDNESPQVRSIPTTVKDATKSLHEALCNAQAEIENASKDSRNPQINNTYASLASVLNEIRRVWPRHGLALVQTTELLSQGTLVLRTLVTHRDGGEIVGHYPIRPVSRSRGEPYRDAIDPQSYGSALTYARRYCAAAIAGISQVDDDGNAASGRSGEPERSTPPKARSDRDTQSQAPKGGRVRSAANAARLFASMRDLGISADGLRLQMEHAYGKTSTKDLTGDEINELIAWGKTIQANAQVREPGEEG